jgi:hypothetical protein
VGDPDLIGDPQRRPIALAALLGEGDTDAFAGFRAAHVARVRRFCGVVCARELQDQACESAFVEFIGRLREGKRARETLESLLLKATRSAAAGRFEIWRPLVAVERSGGGIHPDCAAMPELLAALENGELESDPALIRDHVAGCPTCATTAERLRLAEQEFLHV